MADNTNMFWDAECSSSEYKRLDLLLGQSSTSGIIKESHLPSFDSFSQPLHSNVHKCISTSSNSIACDTLQNRGSLCDYQQCVSIHIDEEEELLVPRNLDVLPNTFPHQTITEDLDGIFEESTNYSSGHSYPNEFLTSKHIGETNHIFGNTVKPNNQTENLELEENVSLPCNYSWKKLVGIQEKIRTLNRSLLLIERFTLNY